MDEENLWVAPKAAVGADTRDRPWFGLRALLWGSVFGTVAAGLLMMALNYRAQGRRSLFGFVAGAAVLFVVPALGCGVVYLLVTSDERSPVAQALVALGCIAAQPLATIVLLGNSHRRAIAERLRDGLPMRPAAHAALVVAAVWSLPAALALFFAALPSFFVVG
ncbi:hypothetical protein [Lysobacter enzymogenes]|uniref:hypothetical protein n=1 Tax=Lysobacter enzymogenes TaxID=69 RepID=UPI001A95A529|nr:hypothetical protein [Lysobacter enzymogenes]QQP95291.1 hypothetical protein JHW38_18915 [Lysobacter enzymogenes]